MANYPAPTSDLTISGLYPITDTLTIYDLLVISVKLADGYYTGKITLEQIRRFFLDNTTALEISGLISLLDGKSNTGHKHNSDDILDLSTVMATKANAVHTHSPAQVIGLASLLDAKANLSHIHEMGNINGLITALSGKANVSHAHEITDVAGLDPRLRTLEDAVILNAGNHEHQLWQIIGLEDRFADKADAQHNHQISNISGLVDILANKSEVGHTHSFSEIGNIAPLLSQKADVIHVHEVTDVTGLELTLSEKADIVHEHGIDDITLLRDTLDSKATIEHMHRIDSIENLDLVLNNKSNLDHTHPTANIEGLDETLSQKSNISHKHNASDITDLDTTLEGKADAVHRHTIEDVTNLRTELNLSEKTSNKVTDLSTPSDIAYPSVNAVVSGVNNILIDYNFPVKSVNGLMGDVFLTKDNFGLSDVDNTPDRLKPVSEPVQTELSKKVDDILYSFDETATPGRVVAGDDYRTIIQKLQWQIDVLTGLLEEPLKNLLQIIPDGYSLKLIFDKPVKFRNNPISDNLFNKNSLFNDVFDSSFYIDLGLLPNFDLIDIEAEENTLTITLKPNWISPENFARIDSIDQEGGGTGIVSTVVKASFKNFISNDGSLVDPIETDLDLTIHTNLSERNIVHDDAVYERAVILGTWAGVPNYSYVSPDTIFGTNRFGSKLTFDFSRIVLLDDKPLTDYNTVSLALLDMLFESTEEYLSIRNGLNTEFIDLETDSKNISISLMPGFLDNQVFKTLDKLAEGIGVIQLPLAPKLSNFTSIDGEDIVNSNLETPKLDIYTNNSASGNVLTDRDYQEATIIGVWDEQRIYTDIPAVPVSDLRGVAIVGDSNPVGDLVATYIPDVVSVSDLTVRYEPTVVAVSDLGGTYNE